MTQKELLVVSSLEQYGHVNEHIGATIMDIITYASAFAELKDDKQYKLSESSARRTLPKLVFSGLVAEGDLDGLKKTYYVTAKGKKVISQLTSFRTARKQKLASVNAEIEKAKQEREKANS